MLKPIAQAAGLRCTNAVKMADCAAPRKLIHVVSDRYAGYRFRVKAYIYQLTWIFNDQCS